MSLSQKQSNRITVSLGWALMLGCSTGMIVCLSLWFTDRISDRVMIGLTLALSWLALVVSGAIFLLQALTKRDVDETGN